MFHRTRFWRPVGYVALLAALVPGSARANYCIQFDTQYNPIPLYTGVSATAFVLELQAIGSNTVTLNELVTNTADNPYVTSTQAFGTPGQYYNPPNSWPSNITVANNGTSDVTVTFTGSTFTAGMFTHIGVQTTAPMVPDAMVKDAYWTDSKGDRLSGPGSAFPTVSFQNPSTDYWAYLVNFWSGPGPGAVGTGDQWIEGLGTNPILTAPPGTSLYYSISSGVDLGSIQIPLENLNYTDYPGSSFGTQGPIQHLSGLPEPSSVVLALCGALGTTIAYARQRHLHRLERGGAQ